MVISRQIRGLLPYWASFFRGVLELNSCYPTTNREDLVKNSAFTLVKETLEEAIYQHFEGLEKKDPKRLESLISWHRYTLAGAALTEKRLRQLLKNSYLFSTSQGSLTFQEILRRSPADPLEETEFDKVLWFNPERNQERYATTLFSTFSVPCVHTLKSFEMSLLTLLVEDQNEEGQSLAVARGIGASSKGFVSTILGASHLEKAPTKWQDYLGLLEAQVYLASLTHELPVLAFINERQELLKTFEELKKTGEIPEGFQRMIHKHFQDDSSIKHEIILNTRHALVEKTLQQTTAHPIASILRLQVLNALDAAGASISSELRHLQIEDLNWIADTLGKSSS
jgi:molecular chaperone HtpG